MEGFRTPPINFAWILSGILMLWAFPEAPKLNVVKHIF